MPKTDFKVYRIRWMMLAVYMFMVAVNQMLWITFAPITGDATKYYGVSDLRIGILSMCFMIVYIVVSIPASWIIDKYGIRKGVGIGAVFTGVFGLVRGFAGPDYNLLLLSQIGIAIGQPFILNAITKLAARWFPMEERATAAGLGHSCNVYRNFIRNDTDSLPDYRFRNWRNVIYLWNNINSDHCSFSYIL